jgi:hypothetical protein
MSRLLSRRSPRVRRRRFADPCQHLLRKPFRVALSLPGEIDQFVGYDFFSRLGLMGMTLRAKRAKK